MAEDLQVMQVAPASHHQSCWRCYERARVLTKLCVGGDANCNCHEFERTHRVWHSDINAPEEGTYKVTRDMSNFEVVGPNITLSVNPANRPIPFISGEHPSRIIQCANCEGFLGYRVVEPLVFFVRDTKYLPLKASKVRRARLEWENAGGIVDEEEDDE